MADYIVDAAESYDPSASSILNRLPGKRIDSYVRESAQRGIPQQGAQTGGYVQAYAGASHIPLFPLYSDEQHNIMAKTWGNSSNYQAFGKQDLAMKDKLTIKAMEHMSGGGGTVTSVRWLGRTIVGLEVMAANMAVEQNQTVVATRWAVPTQSGVPWFVDVLEVRYLDPNSTRAKLAGNAVSLKTGLPVKDKVTLKVANVEVKNLKGQKTWSKKRGKEEFCEAIALVDGGRDIPLQIAARIQRACSVIEGREMVKRFDDHWLVPICR